MTDREWKRKLDAEQDAEFHRLCATVKPCSSCGGEGLVFSTLMSCPFGNWFRIECYEGRGGCGKTLSRQHGHSGLVAVVKEWNEG